MTEESIVSGKRGWQGLRSSQSEKVLGRRERW